LGKSTGNFKSAGLEDLAQDAQAGFNFLRQYPGIDPNKVGLIGHSQGSMVVPMVATTTDHVAFVVLLSGQGIRGDKRYTLSDIRVATYLGADKKVIRAVKDIDNKSFAELEAEKDDVAAKKVLDDIIAKNLAKLNDSEKAQLKDVFGEELKDFEASELNTWYRAALLRDPGEIIQKIKCPVLVVNGDKDSVMTCPENLNGIKAALKKGGNSNCTTKIFHGLNHLLQHCKTGSPKETIVPQVSFAHEVIMYFTNWVVKKTE
jgi:pimeloyl-ACP methyl ester carboxylesterase